MRIMWQTKVFEAKTKVCWSPPGSLGWVMCTPGLSKQVLKEIMITFEKQIYGILYLCSTVVRKIVRWFPPVREMPRQERQAKQVPSTLSLTWRWKNGVRKNIPLKTVLENLNIYYCPYLGYKCTKFKAWSDVKKGNNLKKKRFPKIEQDESKKNLWKMLPDRIEDANSNELVMCGCAVMVTGFRSLHLARVKRFLTQCDQWYHDDGLRTSEGGD